MSAEENSVEIVICLGSSCYARGNSENLAVLKKHECSNPAIRLKGSLCQGQCSQSPNLMIGGKPCHGVTAAELDQILHQLDQQP